jgi:hypothetical protein
VFNITAATAVVTSPNGGEFYSSGCGVPVTWNSSTYSSSYVRIDYSTDNGVTWINYTTATSNDGSETISAGINVTSQFIVRVSNYDNLAIFDVSNAVASITPAYTLTYPNGGEVINGCTTVNITWTNGSCFTNNTSLAYSIDNGATWNTIANFVSGYSYAC